MPIVDVSGLTEKEGRAKVLIRKGIKSCFANNFGISDDDTTVTFIPDDTITRGEHILARCYSWRFMDMEIKKREAICDQVVEVLEIAKHPYNEAFPIPVLAMRGRALNTSGHRELVIEKVEQQISSVFVSFRNCCFGIQFNRDWLREKLIDPGELKSDRIVLVKGKAGNDDGSLLGAESLEDIILRH